MMFTLMHGCLLTFIYLHVYQIGRKLWWKYRLESLALLQYQRVRELHREMNVELPLHDRHPVIVYRLESACSNLSNKDEQQIQL